MRQRAPNRAPTIQRHFNLSPPSVSAAAQPNVSLAHPKSLTSDITPTAQPRKLHLLLSLCTLPPCTASIPTSTSLIQQPSLSLFIPTYFLCDPAALERCRTFTSLFPFIITVSSPYSILHTTLYFFPPAPLSHNPSSSCSNLQHHSLFSAKLLLPSSLCSHLTTPSLFLASYLLSTCSLYSLFLLISYARTRRGELRSVSREALPCIFTSYSPLICSAHTTLFSSISPP